MPPRRRKIGELAGSMRFRSSSSKARPAALPSLVAHASMTSSTLSHQTTATPSYGCGPPSPPRLARQGQPTAPGARRDDQAPSMGASSRSPTFRRRPRSPTPASNRARRPDGPAPPRRSPTPRVTPRTRAAWYAKLLGTDAAASQNLDQQVTVACGTSLTFALKITTAETANAVYDTLQVQTVDGRQPRPWPRTPTSTSPPDTSARPSASPPTRAGQSL